MIPVSELKNMPDSTLIEAFRKLNVLEWSDDLGEKPEGWNELPIYTKRNIILPYATEIANRIPQSQIYPDGNTSDMYPIIGDLPFTHEIREAVLIGEIELVLIGIVCSAGVIGVAWLGVWIIRTLIGLLS